MTSSARTIAGILRLRFAWLLVVLLGADGLARDEPCPRSRRQAGFKAEEWKRGDGLEAWSWLDRDNCVRTRTDLEEIIRLHREWVESDEAKGRRADLEGASLRFAVFSPEVDLSRANLARINLHGARLDEVNLSGASLIWANLYRATLGATNLKEADLRGAVLSYADLIGADLSGARLSSAGMLARMIDTNLSAANMSGAELDYANLTESELAGTDLTDARLSNATLTDALFAPLQVSIPADAVSIRGDLTTLKFWELNWRQQVIPSQPPSDHGLVELREIMRKARMRQKERELTYAINSGWAEYHWRHGGVAGRLVSALQVFFFGWTSGWGLYPWRPILILGILILLLAPIYAHFIGSRKSRKDGIFRVWSKERLRTDLGQSAPERLQPESSASGRLSGLVRYVKAFLWGLYFSLLSSFNLGWRHLSVGHWIMRIQKREYSLRATGWARVLSGAQSVASVYLIALWLLTIFGRPF